MEQELTIRLAARDEVAALPLMQVAAGNLFREMDLALVADGPPPDVAVFAVAQQAGRLLVASTRGQSSGSSVLR